jgi:deazaflavin-dependent oxidoreductase (nitroreductase family)
MALDSQVELSPQDWVREQTEKILESGTTSSVDIIGRPVVLVTMRGAKSGKLRYVPLMRVEHDGSYALVASMGGAPKNPVWYHNLKTADRVRLQDGDAVGEYTVREVDGAERAQWWERAVEAYPPYAEYQTKTDRLIPVFVVDPV